MCSVTGALYLITGTLFLITGAAAGLVDQPMQGFLNQPPPDSRSSSTFRTVGTVAAGIGRGLVGVVVKPIGGAAELISLTGHGEAAVLVVVVEGDSYFFSTILRFADPTQNVITGILICFKEHKVLHGEDLLWSARSFVHGQCDCQGNRVFTGA